MTNEELLTKLQALTGPGIPPASGQAHAIPIHQPTAPIGILVGATFQTPMGAVSGYIQLGPEAARDPAYAIMQLVQSGWQVRVQQQGGYGGGGFQNNGGYNYGRRPWGRQW